MLQRASPRRAGGRASGQHQKAGSRWWSAGWSAAKSHDSSNGSRLSRAVCRHVAARSRFKMVTSGTRTGFTHKVVEGTHWAVMFRRRSCIDGVPYRGVSVLTSALLGAYTEALQGFSLKGTSLIRPVKVNWQLFSHCCCCFCCFFFSLFA